MVKSAYNHIDARIFMFLNKDLPGELSLEECVETLRNLLAEQKPEDT